MEAAGRAIQEFIQGVDFSIYERNEMLRAATERRFEVNGEALGRLRDTDAEIFAGISEGNAIIAFRHRIIHRYDTVDDEIVWEAAQVKLPILLTEVRSHLHQE
ncbi:MAG: HepT-like ribonuclease domain-containing protein [Gammaproteobacteria bacterium]